MLISVFRPNAGVLGFWGFGVLGFWGSAPAFCRFAQTPQGGIRPVPGRFGRDGRTDTQKAAG